MRNPFPLIAALVVACFANHASAATPNAQEIDDRPDITISASDRTLAIDNLVKDIREQHYSVAEGNRIAAAVARVAASGRYAAITRGRAMAAALTRDLREISGDQHFLVDYFARARPFPPPPDVDKAAQAQDYSLTNFGVVDVARLDGNIGYLRIDKFAPPEGAGPVIRGALRVLAATDALIIDLRRNGGGYAGTAALLAAELLPAPARMSDIVARDDALQVWTPSAPAKPYLDKPVYVLVAARTFSAAEGFAYDLRALDRVRIVGEATRGGANPVTRTLLSPHFWVLVPTAHAVNPVTGTNWDGIGVKPDLDVAADEALDAAKRDAAKQLIARHRDDPLTKELEAMLAQKE
jgi:hypothetical protein